eukprot:XP_020406517.1 uncharacterized protein LOC109945118 [Zea mays]
MVLRDDVVGGDDQDIIDGSASEDGGLENTWLMDSGCLGHMTGSNKCEADENRGPLIVRLGHSTPSLSLSRHSLARPCAAARPLALPRRHATRSPRAAPPHAPARTPALPLAHHSRAAVHHRHAAVRARPPALPCRTATRARPLSTHRPGARARPHAPRALAAACGSPFVHAVHRSRLVHAVPVVHAIRPQRARRPSTSSSFPAVSLPVSLLSRHI